MQACRMKLPTATLKRMLWVTNMTAGEITISLIYSRITMWMYTNWQKVLKQTGISLKAAKHGLFQPGKPNIGSSKPCLNEEPNSATVFFTMYLHGRFHTHSIYHLPS